MPDPQYLWVDAPAGTSVRFGGQIFDFGGGKILLAEDIDYRKGFRSVDFVDINGIAKASVYASVKGIGSATLQLSGPTTSVVPGEAFGFDWSDAGQPNSRLSCIVTEVGLRQQVMDTIKLVIQFAEYLNPGGS